MVYQFNRNLAKDTDGGRELITSLISEVLKCENFITPCQPSKNVYFLQANALPDEQNDPTSKATVKEEAVKRFNRKLANVH